MSDTTSTPTTVPDVQTHAHGDHSRSDPSPRTRLLAGDGGQLGSAELLAVLLGSNGARETPLALANRLLEDAGGLDGLLNTPAPKLLKWRGLGPARVAALKALATLSLRLSEAQLARVDVRPLLGDAASVSRYLQRHLGHRPREIFACLFLDARHRLVAFEELFHGSINRAFVFPREVLKRALELNAAAVVLGHNHPSGFAEPSAADLALTRELSDLLARLDVRVLDHIIVSSNQTVSLASRGLLPAVD